MNYFTKNLLDSLSLLKNGKRLPEMNGIEISDDASKILKIGLAFEDEFQSEQLSHTILNASLCFMILDSDIDSRFQNMESDFFSCKYKKLPKNNNIEIMFSQLYRILKLYRNATVHHVSGISFTKDFIEIKYNSGKSGKTEHLFVITYKGVELIEDMILCFFYYELTNYSYNYKEYLYYSFYADIQKEIKAFNDEHGNIRSVKSKKINRIEHFNCHSINYKILNDVIIFDIPVKITNRKNYAIDINISIDEKKYIIPIEVVNDLNQMSVDEFSKFELI
jgi:hypothetical protein